MSSKVMETGVATVIRIHVQEVDGVITHRNSKKSRISNTTLEKNLRGE